MAKSSSPSPAKRAKSAAAKTKKNAFDIMAASARLCWPSSRQSAVSVLEIVAKNGWLSWKDDEEPRQSPTFSNLRLTSRGVKNFMDEPAHGGPDFEAIFDFLDLKNFYNDVDDTGFCHHCFSTEGKDCDTCDPGYDYESCSCKEAHRHGPALMLLDPRLLLLVNWKALPARKRATLMLRFLRKVASNFLSEYYEEWEGPGEPDLTLIDPNMYFGGDVFYEDLVEHNLPFYNFVHHLLFTGWAENDCPPGSYSPYRGRLLGDGQHYNEWHGGHRETFHEMFQCFMGLHKSNEEKTVPVGDRHPRFTVSQLQYLPETIRRCVRNTVDLEAVSLLGTPIADSIDLYRLVRETYNEREEELSEVQWMPCLGVTLEDWVEDFDTPGDFSEYNPQHVRENIDCTSLHWG